MYQGDNGTVTRSKTQCEGGGDEAVSKSNFSTEGATNQKEKKEEKKIFFYEKAEDLNTGDKE